MSRKRFYIHIIYLNLVFFIFYLKLSYLSPFILTFYFSLFLSYPSSLPPNYFLLNSFFF